MNQINKIWNPPPKLKISSWADSYRKLSPESSAEPGQFRTSRAEYQRGIMDAFSDTGIERIVCMTSAQVGKTEIILNAIGYYIDQDPSPILVVQPTLQMGMSFSKDRLATMLRDSEKLRDIIKDSKSKDSGNTTMHKIYPGGSISIVGSNSTSGLSSRAIRVLLLDEVDRYELSTKEGSPISLAIARTKTFANRKIYLCSTPTIKGLSMIESAFEESDQRYYFVPCPECNHKQKLVWKNVIWDKGKPETAKYACSECGSLIDESKKTWMIKNGEWRSTKPTSNIAGFHISELYSVFSTWVGMATTFLESKNNPEMLKSFVNLALGESWEDQSDSVEHEQLLQKRLNFDLQHIPSEVLVMTAASDLQKDRIEMTICGWAKGFECYVLEHKIFWGDPNTYNIWSEVDQFLKTIFKTEDKRSIGISCSTFDSGGHHTNAVYEFTRPRQGRRIFSIKGLSVPGKPIVNKPTFVGKNRTVLYGIGTDTAKENIFARLSAPSEKNILHFAHHLDEEYFKQLTAEKRITKFVRGRKTLVWKQIRPDNEALDCLVYNFAAIYILNPNFDVIEAKMLEDPKPQKTVRRNTARRPGNFATDWKK